MDIKNYQKTVDKWINTVGVRYFNVMTNTIILAEEVGEFSKIIARTHGEQSFKKPTSKEESFEMIKDEMADIYWVLTCLANQLNIDVEEILVKNLEKKNIRDAKRHIENDKLKF